MAEAISLAIGFVLGVVTAMIVGLHAFKLAATYQRTGYAEVKPSGSTGTAIPGIPVNMEVSAQRRIIEESKARGADALQAMALAQGQRLDRTEAEMQAERMMRGESPLGGVS